MKKNVVREKSFEFAIRIINLYKNLTQEKKEFVLSKQLLRSGTSVGANIEEAIGGISKADFRAKMSISYKEIRETIYWLRLLHATDYLEEQVFEPMFAEADELGKLLYTIIDSSKR
ncbi:MAG: four helix bundle protein [Bacteroidales bacterium]|jgi:four helix bundle protein|nr:four helix bundle protein [Bacteroidales bacterium]MCK9449594.1 four helix bundle protein [Bacteroidales bacterium]MDD3701969.1 four helix bundle protein [Bacteroidales bacterium]MDY0368960.1 four helix bundle protein [Bacteroidales bacterium]